jgi:hypothetical protein
MRTRSGQAPQANFFRLVPPIPWDQPQVVSAPTHAQAKVRSPAANMQSQLAPQDLLLEA